MVEIMGKGLEVMFDDYDISGALAYESNSYNIYEVSSNSLDLINSLDDSEWLEEYGWYRASNGSNMKGEQTDTYTINGVELTAYDGTYRIEMLKENENLDEDDQYTEDEKEFPSLMDYFHLEMQIGQPKNVFAVCQDIAKMNSLTVAELFEKCHKDTEC